MASNKAGRGNRMVVGRSMRQPRFERGTFGSGGRRSIQLSYWRVTTWKARNLLWSSYREHPPQPDVSRRAAHHDAKIARLDDPPHALIEQPQPLRTQPKRHLPLLTGIPDVDHCGDAIEPGAHRNCAAAHEDHHDRRSRRGDCRDQLVLMTGKRQRRAVAEFAFFDAGDHDCHAAAAREGDGTVDGGSPLAPHAGVPDELDATRSRGLEILEAHLVRAARRKRDWGESQPVRSE